MTNTLYYGDNLDVLRRHIRDETVDLIYLDPPFNSNATYNVLFAEHSGERSAAQIKAFEDTWEWDTIAAAAYEEVVEAGGKVSQAMQAFRTFLGDSNMMAYLAMMAPRLLELRRVLKKTGSIYLHCDPTASHYLKMLMDAIFEPSNFRNEIIWQRTGAHSDARRWGRVSDTILFYTKGEDYTWRTQYVPYDDAYVQERYHYRDEKTGRMFWPNTMTAAGTGPAKRFRGKLRTPPSGTHWRFSQERIDEMEAEGRIYYSAKGMPYVKSFLDEQKGKPIQNIWTDIRMTKSGFERIGYPTQKPEALLERIIEASSEEGHVLLDPFCGCGTAVAVAQRLKRCWIGIDITHLAVNLIKHRLKDIFRDSPEPTYEVIGEPEDLTGAEELARSNPYQFQWWALGLVFARPVDGKKGADKGIDGRRYFHDERRGAKTKQVIFSVKAGKLHATHVRDLRGVIEREQAEIGVLISMEAPTRAMRKEAASSGFYDAGTYQGKFPRIQLLTIEDLLNGKQVQLPATRGEATFKKAPAARSRAASPRLPLEDSEE